MDVRFDSLLIHLDCSHRGVQSYWQRLFEHFLYLSDTSFLATLCLTVEIVERLPEMPAYTPIFHAPPLQPALPSPFFVYQLPEGGWLLYFTDEAVVKMPAERKGAAIVAKTTIFQRGRLEDVLMTTLAALLRPHGYYFIHAFAGTNQKTAALLVGESGSGKTTTGLALLAHGWHYLANDLAILKIQPDGIYALPSPGGFCIRPKTWQLVPHFAPIRDQIPPDPSDGNHYLSVSQVVSQWGEARLIERIFFPQLHMQPVTRLKRLRPSLLFPRLIAESVDKWDQPMLVPHLQMLEQLSKQAEGWLLLLGEDMARLPALLQNPPP